MSRAPHPPEPVQDATRALAGALVRSAAAGTAPATVPHLLVLTGPRAGERIALRPSLTIGRSRSADVVLPDPDASRLHARLALGPEEVTVEDLCSKNGTRVNGRPAGTGPQPLPPGAELTVGGTRLRLEDPLRVLGSPSPAFEADVPGDGIGNGPRHTRLAPGRRRRLRIRVRPELAAALLALSAAALALAS